MKMKKLLPILLLLATICSIAIGTSNTKVYKEQGGDTLVVASGGLLNIESGGVLKIAGSTVTTSTSFIWVSTDGNDTTGTGTFLTPYLTITKGLAVATTARLVVMVMPGEYSEADIVWPNTNGVILTAPFGNVTIGQSTKAETAVVTVAPTSTASWSATIENIDIESDYTAGTSLAVANAGLSSGKKLNLYLNGVSLSTKAVTDSSLVVVGTGSVAGAIRVYARGNFNTWEGLVDFTTTNTGDRLRVYNTRVIGSITMNEAVVSECTFINCGLTQSLTVHSDTLYTVQNCWHETDADPDVYSAYTDALSQ
jgi:hypothetical protein